MVRRTWWDGEPSVLSGWLTTLLQCFGTVSSVIMTCENIVSNMTHTYYNVSSAALNLSHPAVSYIHNSSRVLRCWHMQHVGKKGCQVFRRFYGRSPGIPCYLHPPITEAEKQVNIHRPTTVPSNFGRAVECRWQFYVAKVWFWCVSWQKPGGFALLDVVVQNVFSCLDVSLPRTDCLYTTFAACCAFQTI